MAVQRGTHENLLVQQGPAISFAQAFVNPHLLFPTNPTKHINAILEEEVIEGELGSVVTKRTRIGYVSLLLLHMQVAL